ncbi:hypothetical protein ACQP1K_03060 [Sphaerimonospora sp. CA-214678]|uniref:hypothetical protein n=1 Tax=Sphaerimonospora sp. CA-214678 TaxID=3240029 RepID=UPI003D904CC0
MDFWAAVAVLLRRWYVTFPAFLLTIAGAYLVYIGIPPQYESSAVLMLTVPTTGSTQSTRPGKPEMLINPLLNFDGGLNMTASLLVRVLATARTAEELGVRPDGDTGYLVNNGHPNPELLVNTPFLMIEGVSTDPASAQEIVRKVVGRAKVELVTRQRLLNAPPATYITISEVISPTPAVIQNRGRLRPAATASLLGLCAGLMAGFAAESVSAGLRRRRAPRTEDRPPERQPDLPVCERTSPRRRE